MHQNGLDHRALSSITSLYVSFACEESFCGSQREHNAIFSLHVDRAPNVQLRKRSEHLRRVITGPYTWNADLPENRYFYEVPGE